MMEQAFTVVMEAEKSAQEDLKAIMASVKAIASEKASLRAKLNAINTNAAIGKAGTGLSTEAIKKKLDSLSEMGEMESLRLQMAMDRMSKMMSTLSNLLKKMSDTASAITQNIK